MGSSETQVIYPAIHKISVQSSSGVKQLYKMLPLCTERQVVYPDPMNYSDSDKYCFKYLQQSTTSDSAYYSHSSGSNPITYGSLQRPKKSRKKDIGAKQLESLMLAQPRYVLNQHDPYPSTTLPTTQYGYSSNINERKKADNTEGMPNSCLYTAIKKHDPTQPSTSKITTSTTIPIPPSLLRIVNAPVKNNFTKLKLYLKLNKTDYSNPKIEHEEIQTNYDGLLEQPKFIFNVGSNRINSDQAYHHIFPTVTTQTEICVEILPEILQTVMNGHDASLMYFGAISRIKEDLLYSRIPQSPLSNGVFVTSIQWLFKLIDEYRTKKKDIRYSIRISALHYSQKTDKLIDLLSDEITDTTNDNVKCVEDSSFCVVIENRTEIRVETVDQALFYLDRVYDHRVTEEDEIQRTSHTFFYLTIYRYKSNGDVLESGKSRLCLIDLGLGEKNSKSGFMTMPVLGNILITIFQGQKHLPSRQNILCKLLKESIGSTKNKSTSILSTYSPVDGKCLVETENLVQLATKMHKVVRKNTSSPGSRRSYNIKSETSTINGSPIMQNYHHPQQQHHQQQHHQQQQENQKTHQDTVEYNSSSEQSCAETVIFLGPSNNSQQITGYNGCSTTLPPIPGSPLKRKSSSSKGSHYSGGRKSNTSNTPEPLLQPQIIPIDCPPNSIIHSSTSLHNINILSSPKRPTHLIQKSSGSMPNTPVQQQRSTRQSSVPTDLILCNPMLMNSTEKLNNSLKRSKKQTTNKLDEDFYNIDPEKREMVLNWVMEQKIEYGADICGIGKPFPLNNDTNNINNVEKYITPIANKMDSCIQCNEEDIDNEILNLWNQARFLDDIVEDDEESLLLNTKANESLAEKLPSLNILSKDIDILNDIKNINFNSYDDDNNDDNDENINENDDEINDITDEELEKAMEASIASIKSHEILSKMNNKDFPPEMELNDSFSPSMLTSNNTESNFYRRASYLETYAEEKLKQLKQNENKQNNNDIIKYGTNKIKQILNCIDTTTPTTTTTTENTRKTGLSCTLNPPDSKILNKKESLVDKLKLKQLTCCNNTMTTSIASSTSIGTNTIHSNIPINPFKTVKVSSTKPIRTLSPTKEVQDESYISPLPSEVVKQITDQLKSAGLGKSPSLIPLSTNSSPAKTAPRSRKDSESKKSIKPKIQKDKSDNSTTVLPPSPYSKITKIKTTNGTYSSGHGSDETNSNSGRPKSNQSNATNVAIQNTQNGTLGNKNRPRNRESFSASSGYESADYGKYRAAMQNSNGFGINSGKKISASTVIAQKEISSLKALRDSLVSQLSESLKRLNMPDKVIIEDDKKYDGLTSDVIIDLLKQETRQLEKRLNICKSKTMMITTFL